MPIKIAIFILFNIHSMHIDLSHINGHDNDIILKGMDVEHIVVANNIMEHYKNRSLENIIQEIDGIVYIEEWRDIEGYIGTYQVSSYGRIKGVKKNFIKKLCLDRGGYVRTTFTDSNGRKENGGIIKFKTVHRVVAIAFIPNPNNYPEVNHKECDKTDNFYKHLEWCNKSQNQKHLYEKGIRKPLCYWQGKKGFNSPRSRHISQYTKEGKFIKTYGSMRDALRNVGGRGTGSLKLSCLNFERLSYGFKWKYA